MKCSIVSKGAQGVSKLVCYFKLVNNASLRLRIVITTEFTIIRDLRGAANREILCRNVFERSTSALRS